MDFNQIISSECRLFSGIEREQLLHLLGCLNPVQACFSAEQTILQEGSDAKYIGIVLKGSVRLECTDFYGRRSITGVFEQGEIFGEAYSFAGIEGMPVDVVAAESDEILLLESKKMLETCSKACACHRQLICNLLRAVSEEDIDLYRRMRVLSGKTTRKRLMGYLELQAKAQGSSFVVLPFDRQELADYLEVDRCGLSTEIGKLKKEGVIACKKNVFQLLDAKPLIQEKP